MDDLVRPRSFLRNGLKNFEILRFWAAGGQPPSHKCCADRRKQPIFYGIVCPVFQECIERIFKSLFIIVIASLQHILILFL